MSANLFQKIVSGVCLSGSVLFLGYSFFKGNKTVNKIDAFKVRQELVKTDDVKMLYSTMSFFYLQGFKQSSIESFYKLHSIMEIEKPNIVALPISKSDYDNKYLKAMSHPKFREAMDTFQHDLANQNTQAIEKMTSFDLKNLQRLYLMDRCIRNKKCKLIFARKDKEYYEKFTSGELGTKAKIEDYTDIVADEMKPGMKFSLMPESPFKVIVGVIEPELLREAASRWKDKFKQKYMHTILEDEEVLEREKRQRELTGKPIN